MSLLAPWQLLWLGLAVPVVLLYILRRRRQRRVVSTTFLWAQAQRDLLAERPWRRLVPSVPLLLQLLAIALAALALARPVGGRVEEEGAIVAVVVDASASMAADDEGSSRIERARDFAAELAAGLRAGSRVVLVEAGPVANVVLAPTTDPLRIRQAARELAIRGPRADLEGGVALALEAIEDAPAGSRVVVVTDGAEADETLAVPIGPSIEVRWVGGGADGGQTPDNVGIVALDVRPRGASGDPAAAESSDAGDADAGGADGVEVFVRVQRRASADAGSRTVFLTVELVDPEGEARGVVASRRLVLAPDARQNVILRAQTTPDARGRAPLVRARLAAADEAADGALDGFRLDDVAVAPSPGGRRLPVFLVGNAPRALVRLFRADAEVELFRTDVARLGELEGALDGLHVFAGPPPATLPPGDSVWIAPSADLPAEGLRFDAPVEAPRIARWDETDPRLRFVTFSEVRLVRATPIQSEGVRSLVEADVGTLVGVLERPSGELTLIGFDPDASDWPRQPSFVVFFRNLLERARDRRASGAVAPGALGEALRVPAPAGAEVRVRLPDGSERRARAPSELALMPVPAEPGIYSVRVETDGEEAPARVALRNLLDEAESDLSRRLHVVEVAPGGADGRELGVAAAGGPRELAPFVALLLLLGIVADQLWWRRSGGGGR